MQTSESTVSAKPDGLFRLRLTAKTANERAMS